MTSGGRQYLGRDTKMHPLFRELYLSGDQDDPAAKRPRRQALVRRTARPVERQERSR